MIIILFAVGILFGAFGGILMKLGAGNIGTLNLGNFHEVVAFFIKSFTNITILSGVVLYFLSALIWLLLLTKLDISYVQPILALTYVVTPILAIILLNESVPTMRWVGIAIIVLGVFVVARTSSTKNKNIVVKEPIQTKIVKE